MTIQRQVSIVGIIQPAQGSAIQTDSLFYGSPILGTSTTASASTHGRKVAEGSGNMLPAANEDRLGLARPRVGSLLLMNFFRSA